MLIRGQCFTHRFWTDGSTGEPLRCVVTAFRYGRVYYRPKYSNGTLGKPAYFPENEWSKYVKRDEP